MTGPHATVSIDAPLDRVWATMLDTGAYAEWADFIERLDAPQPAKVGDRIRIRVRWDDGSSAVSPEQITALEEPWTGTDGVTHALMAYAYRGLPHRLGLIRTVREQRLSQEPGGPTRYESTMRLRGPFQKFAGPGRIQRGFLRQAAGLKRRCEA